MTVQDIEDKAWRDFCDFDSAMSDASEGEWSDLDIVGRSAMYAKVCEMIAAAHAEVKPPAAAPGWKENRAELERLRAFRDAVLRLHDAFSWERFRELVWAERAAKEGR